MSFVTTVSSPFSPFLPLVCHPTYTLPLSLTHTLVCTMNFTLVHVPFLKTKNTGVVNLHSNIMNGTLPMDIGNMKRLSECLRVTQGLVLFLLVKISSLSLTHTSFHHMYRPHSQQRYFDSYRTRSLAIFRRQLDPAKTSVRCLKGK